MAAGPLRSRFLSKFWSSGRVLYGFFKGLLNVGFCAGRVRNDSDFSKLKTVTIMLKSNTNHDHHDNDDTDDDDTQYQS